MFSGDDELESWDEVPTSVSLVSPLEASDVTGALLVGAVEVLPLPPVALVMATPVPLEPLGPVLEAGPLAPVGPVVALGAGPVPPEGPAVVAGAAGLTVVPPLLAEGIGRGSFEPSLEAHAQKPNPTAL